MSANEIPPSVEPPRALVVALRTMLRPLVKLMIKQQIQHPFLSNLLKSIYIDVAETDFQLGEKKVTLSRLSVLTGIHRREAKRIREVDAMDSEPPSSVTLGAQIIARWISQPPWLDQAGQPKALPRESKDSAVSTFQSLVRSVSVDIHPRSILDEWVRLGVATLGEDDHVALRSAGFVPAKGYDEKAYYVGRNVRDHMSAAFTNLDSDNAPFLERSTYYGSLPEGAVPELAALAREAGQDALIRMNDRALEIKNSAAEGGERRRVNFGVYFYEEAAGPEEDGPSRDDGDEQNE
ncbi:MAG: hypothetical protein ACI8W3_003530 [Myxococcota bacterium]|jgi:hypothetical protein